MHVHARVELKVLDKVACTDADSQVMGPLSIDTSGGGSSFVNGIIGIVDWVSRAGIVPILMRALSVKA